MSVVSKTSLLVESINRKSVAPINLITLDDNFPEQRAFVEDPARYIDAQCSRRAGKTNGLALRYLKTMERHPKSTCLYLALTNDSAKEILWPALLEMNEKYKIGCEFIESKLEMRHPNKSKLKLMGADLKNFIKRIKGRKYPGIGVDESQDFGSHLESLVDDVLTPQIADYEDGWLALVGTPGPVPKGYFFDITQNKKFGFSHHAWTLFENPHMPNPRKFVEDLKTRKEWKDDNPTLRREWFNKWVLDVHSLWIQYNESVNHFQELPKEHKWEYILGVDIGFKDADAIAVLAWSDTSDETYLVEEIIATRQGISKLASMIESAQKKYNAYKIVMDEGALGKKIAEDLRQRFAVPIVAADKAHKQSNVEFLNDALRRGKFKAKGNSRFAQDSYTIQIDWDKSTPNKIVIKKTFHSDIIDSVLYAFRESYSFAHKKEEPKLVRGSKEWAMAQEDDMFEKALSDAQKEHEYQKYVNGES